jgi:hypothetical protein
MSFLAPLFLLGAAAIALPVLFHLVRRSTRERQSFSSLMFLKASPPRLSRRSRIEHWLLLLLRGAAVVLLAFAFARPFLQRQFSPPVVDESSERVLVLLDNSASMQRTGFWAEALASAQRVVRETSPLDEVALYTFARDLQPLITFDQWNAASPGERMALAEERLRAAEPGWSGTHLGQALISAAELAAEQGRAEQVRKVRIVLVSDLQEGARLNALQGYTWPNGVELAVEAVAPKRRSNASLQLITERVETLDTSPREPGVRLRVSNDPDSKKEQFLVGWSAQDEKGWVANPIEVYVPPGQSRIVFLPGVDTNSAAARVRLMGDEEAFDNVVFVSVPKALVVTVLYLGNEEETDARQPLYYLKRALQSTARQVVRVTSHRTDVPIPQELVNEADLLIMTDSAGDSLPALRKVIEAGKVALYVPKSSAASHGLLQLLGVGNGAGSADGMNSSADESDGRRTQYAMLAEIDFRHPVFAPFADPRFSDFTRIQFWKYRRLDPLTFPAGRVLAKFDTGDPALMEVPLGGGRVFAMASGWHPEDSQLALSTKFVPLLYAFIEQSGAPPPPPVQYFVGDNVLFADFKSSAPVEVLSEHGLSSLDSPKDAFTGTTRPAVFAARSGGEQRSFAVNLDPMESRTAAVHSEELESLGAPVIREGSAPEKIAAAQVQVHRTELEKSQKLWRWLILGCIGVLLGETWLAGRNSARLQS